MFTSFHSSIKRKVLITGAAGLLGRITFKHLSKNPNNDIYGIDIQRANSERYRLDNRMNDPLPEFPEGKFFEVDIIDKAAVEKFIKENQFDVVIHYGALLETQSVDAIKKVNEEGTKNVFEACAEAGVKEILFASSIMLVYDYLKKEPYKSIQENTFKSDLEKIVKISADDKPLIASDTESYIAYCNSKLYGEQLAEELVKQYPQLSIICARFCWVNVPDQPTEETLSIWCSQADACAFVEKAIAAKDIKFAKYFVCSNYQYQWIDMSNAEKELGFKAQNDAEDCLKRAISSQATPSSPKPV